jgi:hypothetical protein
VKRLVLTQPPLAVWCQSALSGGWTSSFTPLNDIKFLNTGS